VTKLFWVCGLLATVLAVGCAKTDPCGAFPTKLDQSGQKIYGLPDAEQNDPAIASAKGVIETCYPKASYANRGYPMIPRDSKRLKNGDYILSYDFDGISDIRMAFRVTGKGRIVSAFEISSL
jgi:hypothetical protein